MARVTALRETRPGRVLVEVDGVEWRTLADEVCVRMGLAPGIELDRPRLRRLRRELRRWEALQVAARALHRRDASLSDLRARLRRAGVARAASDEALATLARAGYVDDERFARSMARALCGQDAGDAAIRARLERSGIERDLIDRVVSELPPESERARAAAVAKGGGARAFRYLLRRGFGEDAVEDAVGTVLAREP